MRPKLWTREFVLAIAVGFFISMVFYLLVTTMALYAVDRFAAHEAEAGLASSIFVLGAVVARPPAGIATDRLGRRRVLLAALAAYALAPLGYLVAGNLAMLLSVRLVHGMAFGASHTSSAALVQSLIPPSRRAEGTGYHGASVTLATAVGPLVAVVLIGRLGYEALFVASALAALLAFGAAALVRAPEERLAPGRLPLRHSILERSALPLAWFIFTVAVGYSGVLAFVNPFAAGLDLTEAAGAFFLAYAVVVIVLRVIVGRIQDDRGGNVVVYPAIALLAVGLVVLAGTTTGAGLLLAAVLVGAGFGTLLPAGQALAVAGSPVANVGRVVSTYFLFLDLGLGVGPVLLGLILEPFGYRTMYAAAAGLVLATTLLYTAVHGRGERRGHKPPQP